ncbi:MAG: hypothetical protein FJY54_18180 [Betaproteobacteria bacterium]|nr:hypothetical protein [Betaproteobacteria bacterium]
MAKKKAETTETTGEERATEAPPQSGTFLFEKKRYEFVLRAEQPIAHHSANDGNEAIAFRRRVRVRGGWAEIPIITADTMRHGMREAAAFAVLSAANMLTGANLSEAAIRLLFAGGMVTGRGDAGSISLDRYRELCELVPTMALFGGCCDNRVIPGRLVVEDAMLVCTEVADDRLGYVPAWALDLARDGVGIDVSVHHVEDEQRVRMDPTMHPERRLLMSPDAQVSVTNRLQASEQAHQTNDALAREETKSSMMPRRFERVAAGSLFFWAIEANTYTPLDADVLNVAVSAFLHNARVGGKRGTGHGLLRHVESRGVSILRPAEERAPVAALAKDAPVGVMLRAHIEDRADRIRDFLRGVNA